MPGLSTLAGSRNPGLVLDWPVTVFGYLRFFRPGQPDLFSLEVFAGDKKRRTFRFQEQAKK